MMLLNLIAEYFLDEAKKEFEYLSKEAQTVAATIMAGMGIPKDEIKAYNKNRIIVLSDKPRSEIFSGLEKMGFTRIDPSKSVGSSGGGYESENGIEIIHKPLGQSKTGGAGVSNENIVVDKVKEALAEQPNLTVIFKAKNKDLVYKNVTGIDHIGKEGESKGWKGDIRVLTKDGEKHVSIKKDGGYRWESVMKRFRPTFEAFMTKAMAGEIDGLQLVPAEDNPKLLQMLDMDGRAYGRVFINNHPDLAAGSETIDSMAFGPDHADIAQRTFTDSDFKLKDSTLEISTTKVMTDVKDFEEGDFPIVEFERNASKATKVEGMYGRGIVMRTRPIGQVKDGGRANYLYVEYKDIM